MDLIHLIKIIRGKVNELYKYIKISSDCRRIIAAI
jgi:hypothetical protein